MARPKNPVPVYTKHPTRDTARCWAGGRWIPLGRWNSPESKAAFRQVCAELAASGVVAATARAQATGATLNEVILAFLDHAERFYVRPDGTPTNEIGEYKAALKVVRELYGHNPAAAFGPLALKAVRGRMVDEFDWCRSRVNAQVRRVRRVFKWAASEELVPGSLVADLGTVAGLRRNRSAAKETKPVKPVPDADYEATLPHMRPTLRAMVMTQRLGGLRPCEVRSLTPADLERTGDVWVFKPDEHKMSHAGRDKAVPLSPSARAVLEPWLAGRGEHELLFTPAMARAERYAALRASRKSKVQPSQRDRSKPTGRKQRQVPDQFSREGYAAAVRRACLKAGVAPWSPGQLRHSFGTEVRSRFGLWDQRAFLDELLATYDKLDEDLRAELPLKRIWTVAAQEEGE